MDVLVDVGAIGAGEILLFVDLEQLRSHEIRAVLERRLINLQQQLDLVGGRYFEGVLNDGRPPGDLAEAFLRGQDHRAFLQAGVCLGDGDGLFGGAGDGFGGKRIGGVEAPAAVGNHAHPCPVTLGVRDVFDVVLASDDELGEVASDADIGVGRALLGGRVESGIGELFLFRSGCRCRFPKRADRAAPRGEKQRSRGQSGVVQELTSVHMARSPVTGCPAVLNRPGRTKGKVSRLSNDSGGICGAFRRKRIPAAQRIPACEPW